MTERERLIEQIIQDCNEGFIDNIKANISGAKDWLKADARNSFRLKNKDEIKTARNDAREFGKIKSYAKSLVNTLKSYKEAGGTLGKGMKLDDVIFRLSQAAKGKYPKSPAPQSNLSQAFITDARPTNSQNNNIAESKDKQINKPTISDTLPTVKKHIQEEGTPTQNQSDNKINKKIEPSNDDKNSVSQISQKIAELLIEYKSKKGDSVPKISIDKLINHFTNIAEKYNNSSPQKNSKSQLKMLNSI